MATLNDSKFATLRALGHTGAMSDMVLQWLQANGATSKAVTDSWMEMLVYEDETSSQRNDAWYNLLDGLAPVEIGRQLNDLEMWFWSGSGGAGHIPKTLLSVILQNSLIPARATGSSVATFTRASTATFTDFEGITRTALSGEPRFMGARRVENMLSYSEDFSNAVWKPNSATVTSNNSVAPDGTTTATTVATDGAVGNQGVYYAAVSDGVGKTTTTSVWAKSISGSTFMQLGDAANRVTVTLTTEWQRVSTPAAVLLNVSQVFYATNNTVAEFAIWHPQVEDVTGQANQNPSEYVSTGALSAPYHGANIDGVQYFKTLNGNTVASNVVTEATGIAITDVGPELAINGDFSDGLTGWSATGSTTAVVNSGEAIINQPVAGNWYAERFRTSASAFVSGKAYVVKFDAWNISGSATMRAANGANSISDQTLTAERTTYEATYTATIDGNLQFFNNGSISEFGLDNVSMKEVDASTADASGPFGYISESAMTNSIPYSRDLTNAAWTSTATEALNEIGMDGVPNTVCTVTDDSVAQYEYINDSVAIANDSNTLTVRAFIKKDSDETRFPELEIVVNGGTALHNSFDINTKTGAFATRSSVGTVDGEVNSYGDWWEVLASVTNNSTGNTNVIVQLYPSVGTVLGVANAAAVGSIIVGNVELYTNTTIEGVKGRAVIFTEGSAVTKAADSLTYDDVDNIEDAAGNALMDASSFWGTAVGASVSLARSGDGLLSYIDGSFPPTSVRAYDGTSVTTSPTGTSMLNAPQRVGSSWGDHLTAYFNGVADASPADYDGAMGTGPIGVGIKNDGIYQWNGTIRNLVIKDREINASTYILFVPLGSDDLITSDSLTFKVVG